GRTKNPALSARAGAVLEDVAVALAAGDVVDVQRLLLALHPRRLERAVLDELRHRLEGRLADDDLAGPGDRAQPRRRVHRIADGRVLLGLRRSEGPGDDGAGVDADADMDRLQAL